jgi:integrase
MSTKRVGFEEYLRIKNYSDNTVYVYLLYSRLLNNDNPKQIDVDNLLSQHNNGVVRAFLKVYLYEYLRKGSLIITRQRGREIRYSKDKGLDYERYKQIRHMVVDRRLGLMMDISFEANLRVSELVHLKPTNIDFIKNEVTGIGKGKVEYVGFLSKETIKELMSYISEYRIKDDEFIFPITRQRVWAIYKRYEKYWGVHYHPHLQKHSRNIHMRDVLKLNDGERQYYNRHKNRDTTINVYGGSDVSELPKKIKDGFGE